MTRDSTVPSGKSQGVGQKRDGALAEVAGQYSVAFADFYSSHIDQIYRYVLIRVGDSEVAQDLTSETFLAALENLQHFRGEGLLVAWILGIARNKISDYFRSHRSLLPLDDAASVISTNTSPEEWAERQWQLSQVSKMLRMLGPNRADALALFIFASLNIDEVSQVLGKSSSAVKILIYRAVQDLKMLLTKGIET